MADEPCLGPLADLAGLWKGSGFNQITLPASNHQDDPNQEKPDAVPEPPFRSRFNKTRETLEFLPIHGAVPGMAPDGYAGLRYLHQVSDERSNALLHNEPGLWLLGGGSAVVRQASIPHGHSLLVQGCCEERKAGFPEIQIVVNRTDPFGLAMPSWIEEGRFEAQIGPRLARASPPEGLPPGVHREPHRLLQQVLAEQKSKHYEIDHVRIDFKIGITEAAEAPGTADDPVQQTRGSGPVANLPFPIGQAKVSGFKATFWLETVTLPDRSHFMQLQYSQTVLLEFSGALWPHIAVATLVKL